MTRNEQKYIVEGRNATGNTSFLHYYRGPGAEWTEDIMKARTFAKRAAIEFAGELNARSLIENYRVVTLPRVHAGAQATIRAFFSL